MRPDVDIATGSVAAVLYSDLTVASEFDSGFDSTLVGFSGVDFFDSFLRFGLCERELSPFSETTSSS